MQKEKGKCLSKMQKNIIKPPFLFSTLLKSDLLSL